MAFQISEIMSALSQGGARNSLFSVQIFNPVNPVANFRIPFLVKAATLPASQMGKAGVNYFGRHVWFAGDRTYDPWDITVLNDEDFSVRNSMETWMNAMSGLQNPTRTTPIPAQYKSQANIIQYGKNQVPIRQYTFYGMFPTLINDITVDWSQTDTIEEFRLTLSYDYWLISGGVTGDAGGNGNA